MRLRERREGAKLSKDSATRKARRKEKIWVRSKKERGGKRERAKRVQVFLSLLPISFAIVGVKQIFAQTK